MIKEYFYHYEIMANDFQVTLGQKNSIKIFHNHDESNRKITMADTGSQTLKGARLKKIEKYIDSDSFMVTYGDGVANINISALVDFHKTHGKIATLSLT